MDYRICSGAYPEALHFCEEQIMGKVVDSSLNTNILGTWPINTIQPLLKYRPLLLTCPSHDKTTLE
jgi:hypothetical protein